MQELVIMKKGQALCSSLQVAEIFEKEHYNILRDIDNLLSQITALNFEVSRNTSVKHSNEKSVPYFHKSFYKDSTGKSNKMYYMNRDGFSLLVMGFTGRKALEWKLKYIEAFNKMETTIRELASREYLESRNLSKLTRKQETDVLKNLVEYAKGQGSKHSEKLYVVYSNLANKTVGIKDRRFATPNELSNLALVESILMRTIHLDIIKQMPYKDIYKDCKEKMEILSSIDYLIA